MRTLRNKEKDKEEKEVALRDRLEADYICPCFLKRSRTMMPIGPLMIEHRLIERMVKLMKNELEKMEQEHRADVVFISKVIDFIGMYADRCHHGKEEDILFRDLSKKKLSAKHKKIIGELVQEHAYGRKITNNLAAAKEKYVQGSKEVLQDIIALLKELAQFYPKHIEKEDKHFFLPSMRYFDKKEQAEMLNEFWEFDKKLIHEKYKAVVSDLEMVKK